MSKHVLLIMPYGGVGGMERLAVTFYNRYRAKGYKVTALKLIALPNDVVSFGEDEIAFSNADLVEMSPLRRLGFYLRAPVRLRRVIKGRGITHSVAFGDVSNIFSSLTLTNEFKVASIHSLKSVELLSRTWLARVAEFSYRWLYGAFDRVVCISKGIADDLVANCGFRFPGKIAVIYNPHDVAAIVACSKEPLLAEARMFEKPVVIFVGRISSPKAPGRLVHAFERLVQGGNDCNLVFLGDGQPDLTQRLMALVNEKDALAGRVFFLGRKENPYKYLARSAVLAMTSRFEGTPNVIVESIALGVPVVSSYCTEGIPELMCRDGCCDECSDDSIIEADAGLITPHYADQDDMAPHSLDPVFATALQKVLVEPRHRSRLDAARDILLEKFDPEVSTERYLSPVVALEQRNGVHT